MEQRELAARGYLVTPGFVDLHAHLREPGFEDSETIASGARAALRGGFTTICAMPNTQPVVDSPGLVSEIVARAVAARPPIATITRPRERSADLVELSAPARSPSRRRSAAQPTRLFRHARIRANRIRSSSNTRAGALGKGVMHEGVVSARLGLPGVPSAAEETAVSRDIAIAEMTGARLHLTHISTRGAIASIRSQAAGRSITCGVSASPIDDRGLGRRRRALA
jgi:dihydroorotase